MPNAKVLSEKKAIVAALEEKLKGAASGVLVDYKGITVAEDTALREELRKNGVDYAVVKNTLVRFALDDAGLNELDEVLHGTTALAVSAEDPIAPMRVINKFNGEKFIIKAGFMDGKVLPLNDIAALADLPSKEVLLAQMMGTMLAPVTKLAIVLKAIAENGGASAAAPAAEAAPAAAPAEEAAPAEAPAEETAAPAEEAAPAEAPAEEAPAAEAEAPAEEAPAAEAETPAAE